MEVPDDELEDSEVFYELYKSEHECPSCSDQIMLVEEVYALWVVQATAEHGFQVSYAESADGDLLYTPQFFCFSCWETLVEDLLQALATDNNPPIRHDRGVFDCSLCGSSILPEEYFAQVTVGEIHHSEKVPNKELSFSFHVLTENPQILCISCLKTLNDEVVEMWEGGVDQEDECDHGTHIRCWRNGCELDVCIHRNQEI